jgi:hypothetical protein
VVTLPDGSHRKTVTVDGGGLLLQVYRTTPEGFDGRWDRLGIKATGSGIFCARRVLDGAR